MDKADIVRTACERLLVEDMINDKTTWQVCLSLNLREVRVLEECKSDLLTA